MEERALYYFRIKTECTVEGSSGELTKKKTEELVLASCYAEAEELVHELAEALGRNKYENISYEIVKTKIADVLFNEILAQESSIKDYARNFFQEDEISGVGLYAVKVVSVFIDEKTAKEKTQTEVFYVPAESNADATNRINKHLGNSTFNSVVRDTKFDKAEAIYWPLDVQKMKLHAFKYS